MVTIKQHIENYIRTRKDYLTIVEEERDSTVKAVLEVLSGINDPYNKKEIISALYWNYQFFTKPLAEYLGIKTQSLASYVFPYSIEKECPDCKNKFCISIKSKTRLNTNGYVYDGFGVLTYRETKYNHSTRCEKCSNTRANDVASQYEASVAYLRNMPYHQYLKTGHWEKTRKRALYTARYRCELCAETKNLHVHHKPYENKGDEPGVDLIVLCANCHAKFHDKLEEIES